MLVSAEIWWEARTWAPSLVPYRLREQKAPYLPVEERVGNAGGGRNRGGTETGGPFCPKWVLGAVACAPLTEMPAGGPRELALGVPGCR